MSRLMIYAASRASVPERVEMWKRFRAIGRERKQFDIISSWIDEADEGVTADFRELWRRIEGEIALCDRLVLYAKSEDFPLKGALLEAGIAIGLQKPVFVCLPGVAIEKRSCRPIGSWIAHPLVKLSDITEALTSADRCTRRLRCEFFEPPESPCTLPRGHAGVHLTAKTDS